MRDSEPSASTARFPGRAPVDAYGGGGFRFAGMSHRGSILCLMDAIVAWPVVEGEALLPEHFAAVLVQRDEIDFVILGTGARHVPPSEPVRAAFREAGLALDVMATGPAARTFNIVLGEGRRVVAALVAPC